MNGDPLRSSDVPKPVVIGTGLIALDVVFGPDGGEAIGRWAGGTCGNVLTILSCLGWTSFPVARLDDDEPAQVLRQDLASWDVRLDYVAQAASGSTPVIVQYIRRDDRGAIHHKFSFKCPVCGQHLPGFRPVPSRDVRQVLAGMPRPDVYFFDRCSRGAIDMATAFRESGAVVVFEPSGLGDPAQFREAVRLAHIVKYSRERWADGIGEGATDAAWLVVETLGQDGLRFFSRLPSYGNGDWEYLESLPVKHYRDGAGSGDWCSAGLIASLATAGAEGLRRAGEREVRSALANGQSLAAWNCGYEGARGGMYSAKRGRLGELIGTILPEVRVADLEIRRPPQTRPERVGRRLTSCCDAGHGCP